MKALRLAKDGSLALTEADVQKQILGFLETKRWRVTRTPSDKYMRVAGNWRTDLPAGHPDYICCRNLSGILLEFFYLELKRKFADTEPKRKAAQRKFAKDARKDGFTVCLMPDGLADPYGWFCTWYAEHFS